MSYLKETAKGVGWDSLNSLKSISGRLRLLLWKLFQKDLGRINV